MASSSEGLNMNRSLVLRLLAAAALVGVAVVHLDIAGNYKGLGKHPLALSDQFYAQVVIAFALAAALLVKPHLLVWGAALAFSIGSLAVLVYSRYKALPIYGLDGGFQETWAVKGAKPAAYFEGAAIVLTAAGAALSSGFVRTTHKT
jgi:hypothetical protein